MYFSRKMATFFTSPPFLPGGPPFRGRSRGPLSLYQLGGLGERCKLPQWGPGQSPGRKLAYFEPKKRIWSFIILLLYLVFTSL